MRRVIVGLMSGTSMDGIDAAVVEVTGAGEQSRLKPIAFVVTGYPGRVKERLLAICADCGGLATTLSEISSMNFKLGELFARAAARAVSKAGLSLGEVDLIGSHGQTVYHAPKGKERSTLQLGEPYVSPLYQMADNRKIRPMDLLATATALTACSIGRAYREFILPRLGKVDEIYFTGGGRRNRTLMNMLSSELDFTRVGRLEELGFDGDALEAQAFALLANEAIEGVASTLPRVTGARRNVVLGKIVPGKNYLRPKLGSKT